MKGEILLQNVINLFIIAVILESAIMAIFSMSELKNRKGSRPVEATRDAIIIVISLLICYKVDMLLLFKGTGIVLPLPVNVVLSGLVLSRMVAFVSRFASRFKQD